MTETRNLIHYWAEPLPGKRGQLMRDVVVDSKIVAELSGPIGSPAPIETVRKFEKTITLTSRPTDTADLGDQLLLDSLTQEDAP